MEHFILNYAGTSGQDSLSSMDKLDIEPTLHKLKKGIDSLVPGKATGSYGILPD